VQAALTAGPGTTGEIRWRLVELAPDATQYELTYTLAPGASGGAVHSALLEKLHTLDISGLSAK
jgi:hypothetical protein